MTTVIMAICLDNSLGDAKPSTPYIIACCDTELSMGFTSVDDFWFSKVQKVSGLSRWLMGFAGEPHHFPPIRERLANALHSMEAEVEAKRMVTAQEGDRVPDVPARRVVSALEESYNDYRASIIKERFLDRMGVSTVQELAALGPPASELIAAIVDFDMGIKIVLAGFSDHGAMRLVTMDGEEGLQDRYFGPQAWAIGTGATLAFTHLSALYEVNVPLGKAIYRVLEAKFISEAAKEVGRGTRLVVLHQNGDVQWVTSESIEAFRAKWEVQRKSFDGDLLATLRLTQRSL